MRVAVGDVHRLVAHALGEEVVESVASAETRRETVETIPKAHDAYMPVDNEHIFGMARG